jgi:DNA invertase Pin-like site-specific DNA recombinase
MSERGTHEHRLKSAHAYCHIARLLVSNPNKHNQVSRFTLVLHHRNWHIGGMQSFVAYYRVSTKRQGQSGLGLEAQQAAVEQHIKSAGGNLVASFKEVESGRKDNRPELKEALAEAKIENAIVIIAKLDRLGRRASYILRLIDESGVNFHICDMPNADKLCITVLAAVAEREAENISKRTKAALAALKARGVKLGGPNIREAQKISLRVQKKLNKTRQDSTRLFIIREIVRKGRLTSHAGIAECLNARGIPTARGGQWHTTTVRRLIPHPVKEYAELV